MFLHYGLWMVAKSYAVKVKVDGRRLWICGFCIKRNLKGSDKYIMQITKRGEKALKESMMRRKDGTPRYSRGSLTEIARVLWESLVEPAKIPLMKNKRREDIRDRNIRQLVDAIDQVYAKLKTARIGVDPHEESSWKPAGCYSRKIFALPYLTS